MIHKLVTISLLEYNYELICEVISDYGNWAILLEHFQMAYLIKFGDKNLREEIKLHASGPENFFCFYRICELPLDFVAFCLILLKLN